MAKSTLNELDVALASPVELIHLLDYELPRKDWIRFMSMALNRKDVVDTLISGCLIANEYRDMLLEAAREAKVDLAVTGNGRIVWAKDLEGGRV
jgi:hypothetical protein